MIIEKVIRGADPELFLKSLEDNSPVVSIGLIGGTKDYPRQLGNGYALQEDNVTVEFNIPPAETKEKFKASIEYALEFIKTEVKQKGLDIDIKPTVEFKKEDLWHPQAQELGCEPDYNAWNDKINPRPNAPETLRSAGGHLHIGYENPSKEVSRLIVQAHDLFVSVPSLMYDDDMKRRQIYGKAGACRYKGYGVECRTFSNFWLKTPELIEWVYEQSEKAIDFLNNGGRFTLPVANKIINCVNNGDKHLLAELDAKYGIL